jgi:hypothetical protein
MILINSRRYFTQSFADFIAEFRRFFFLQSLPHYISPSLHHFWFHADFRRLNQPSTSLRLLRRFSQIFFSPFSVTFPLPLASFLISRRFSQNNFSRIHSPLPHSHSHSHSHSVHLTPSLPRITTLLPCNSII